MAQPEVPIPYTAVVPAAAGDAISSRHQDGSEGLLPVVDTPGIELVAAEAAEAGGGRLIIVTSKGKDGVVAHFVEDLVLEGTLEGQRQAPDAREGPLDVGVDQGRVGGTGRTARPRSRGQLCEESCCRTEDAIAVLLARRPWCLPDAASWKPCRRCAPSVGLGAVRHRGGSGRRWSAYGVF